MVRALYLARQLQRSPKADYVTMSSVLSKFPCFVFAD